MKPFLRDPSARSIKDGLVRSRDTGESFFFSGSLFIFSFKNLKRSVKEVERKKMLFLNCTTDDLRNRNIAKTLLPKEDHPN